MVPASSNEDARGSAAGPGWTHPYGRGERCIAREVRPDAVTTPGDESATVVVTLYVFFLLLSNTS